MEIEDHSSEQTYATIMSYYGTEEKLNAVYSQPFAHGTRDFSRSDAPSDLNGKKALLSVMELYYKKMGVKLLNENGEEDVENILNERYDLTYAAIRRFVDVQILAGRDSVPNWSDLSRSTRDSYSLLVEDYVERSLSAMRAGLPLFCTEKFYAVNFFLTAILRNSKSRAPSQRTPPVQVILYMYIKYKK